MQTENDIFISLDERFYQSAYRQIVIQGKIGFPEYDKGIFNDLMRNLPNEPKRRTAKALYELMGEKTFQWTLHEKCLSLCKKHDIYPCGYLFYKDEPQYPTSILEGLDYLTVADIKPLLKAKGLPVSGKREVIASPLAENISFKELEISFLPKFRDKLEDYAKKFVLHQYELLVAMITHRALFLHQLNQINKHANSKIFSIFYEVEVLYQREEQEKLAKLINGVGHSGVIKNNQIVGFLPIFPSGTFSIKKRYEKNQ